MPVAIRATSTFTGWNADRIKQRAARTLDGYQEALNRQLQEEIARPQFRWPRTTRRRVGLYSGRLAGTQRDIIDTGRFAASQNSKRPDPLRLLYTWGGYDGPVTYAGIILRGKANYPRRDWISPALRALPIERYFAQNWGRVRTPSATAAR